MKKIFVVLALVLGSVAAQARPDSSNMTCAEAHAFVIAHNPVIMTYRHSPKAGPLYEKIYKRVCPIQKKGYWKGFQVYAQTKDNNACYIGWACR